MRREWGIQKHHTPKMNGSMIDGRVNSTSVSSVKMKANSDVTPGKKEIVEDGEKNAASKTRGEVYD